MIDVCLILEGTYPFVAGGVSTWIHQLISAMRDLRFSIVNISPLPDPKREFKYVVPPHVMDIQDVYLHDYNLEGALSPKKHRLHALDVLSRSHEDVSEGMWKAFEKGLPYLRAPGKALTIRDIFDSKEAWAALMTFYNKYGKGISFLDFFWTWRSIYLPLYNVLRTPLPEARLYHTISTGYAGLIASMAKLSKKKKMILTEHGIYTHERYLEIAQASWIAQPDRGRFRIEKELPFFKNLWLNLFKTLGSLTYNYADRIVTLYEGNKTREILDGAAPEKISIVPNGIDLPTYKKIKHNGLNTNEPTIAFIGRVVPIKDVKTFLQAAKIVLGTFPKAKFMIMGPTDEEPSYTKECHQMVKSLWLQNNVYFTGKVDVKKYYPDMSLVVLTSLSEAQPYVILEANAVGIPIVATNVGACREMLEGRTTVDRKLGSSGLVTQVSNPADTASAIIKLLKDPAMWQRFSEAGKKRVFQFYDQDSLISQYLNIYEQNLR